MKKNKSIKTQLILTVILALTIIFGLTTFVMSSILRTSMTNVLLDKSVDTANEVAESIELVLENNDGDISKVQKFLEEKAEQENIAYAVVIDTDVKAVAHSDKEKIGKVYDDEYTIDGAKKGIVQTTKIDADVQKYRT